MPGVSRIKINPKKYDVGDTVTISGRVIGAKRGVHSGLPCVIFVFGQNSLVDAERISSSVELKNGTFSIEHKVSGNFSPQDVTVRIDEVPYERYDGHEFTVRFDVTIKPRLSGKTQSRADDQPSTFRLGNATLYTITPTSGTIVEVGAQGDHVRELALDLVKLGYWVSARPESSTRLPPDATWDAPDDGQPAVLRLAGGDQKEYAGFQAWRNSTTSPSQTSDDEFGMGYQSEPAGDKTYDEFLAGAVYTFQMEFMAKKQQTGKLDYKTALKIKRLMRQENMTSSSVPRVPTPGWPYVRAQGAVKKRSKINDFLQLPPSKAWIHTKFVTQYQKIGEAQVLVDNWGRQPIIELLVTTGHDLKKGTSPALAPNAGFTAEALIAEGLLDVQDVGPMAGDSVKSLAGHKTHRGWESDITRITQDGAGDLLAEIRDVRFNKEKSLTLALLFFQNGLAGMIFNCPYVADGVPGADWKVNPLFNHSSHYHINAKGRATASRRGLPEYWCAGCHRHEWFWEWKLQHRNENPPAGLMLCDYANRYGFGTRSSQSKNSFRLNHRTNSRKFRDRP